MTRIYHIFNSLLPWSCFVFGFPMLDICNFPVFFILHLMPKQFEKKTVIHKCGCVVVWCEFQWNEADWFLHSLFRIWMTVSHACKKCRNCLSVQQKNSPHTQQHGLKIANKPIIHHRQIFAGQISAKFSFCSTGQFNFTVPQLKKRGYLLLTHLLQGQRKPPFYQDLQLCGGGVGGSGGGESALSIRHTHLILKLL